VCIDFIENKCASRSVSVIKLPGLVSIELNLKRPGHEVDLSPPSSADIRGTSGAVPPVTLHAYEVCPGTTYTF
jgi:hypothetical protein